MGVEPEDKFDSEDELKALLERWTTPGPSRVLDKRIETSFAREFSGADRVSNSVLHPLRREEVVSMKFCSKCQEEFADKFSFCPVDGTPLTAASPKIVDDPSVTVSKNDQPPAIQAAAAYTEQPEVTDTTWTAASAAAGTTGALALRDEYHLTFLSDEGLTSRLTHELRDTARQYQLTWPEFKRDPFGFTKRTIVGYGGMLRKFLAKPNVMVAMGCAVLGVIALVGAVMLLEDITHLREIDRLKSEFIAGASHELRTPLTTIEMGVHLLLEGTGGELSPKQYELLEMCREGTLRLDALVKDLLDLSKIESGEATPQVVPIDAHDLLVDAVELVRPQAEAKGLALCVDAPVDLPEIAVDRGQVERVITNLVTNAIRATDRGGTIEVSCGVRNGFIAISVRDTGRGIPHDYLDRIFEPFVQVPDAPSGGAGLGLSISRRIVQAHGGQLAVRSHVGQGTTFTFTLPVARPVSA